MKKNSKKSKVSASKAQATETTVIEAVSTEATASEKKSTLKQSRWVKVHEQGQSDFEAKDNVMDITIGDGSYQAVITYKTSLVRNFNKAVYWFLRGLTNAKADVVAQLATETLTAQAANASKETAEITASGNGWSCEIVNAGEGVFKAVMRWTQEATGQTESGN